MVGQRSSQLASIPSMHEDFRTAGASAMFVALAAFFWGLSGGIASVLMADGWNALVLAFCRGAIGLLCVIVWLAWRPHGSGLGHRRLWFWAAIAGFGVAGNFLFYFISIANGSLAVAATLMYCAPVYVYLVSFALKLEAPSPSKWIAMLVVMLGIVLLTGIYDIESSDVTLIGVAAGLLSGLCYAVFIFGFKYAAPYGSPQAILVVAFAALVTILVWPVNFDQTVATAGTPDWLLIGALGMLGAGLSFFLYIVGIRHIKPTVASIVAMIEPITAALFGVAIMSERLAGLQLVGMGLILVTVTLLSIRLRP
jgi:DME family drug/metabolite transporter